VFGKIPFHGAFHPGSCVLHHLGLLSMFYDGVLREKIPILIKAHGKDPARGDKRELLPSGDGYGLAGKRS
jgi:hypothetical protein